MLEGAEFAHRQREAGEPVGEPDARLGAHPAR